ncbi:MAG: hypothetical protein QW835_02615 [Candidatus Hadarchaeum sp.]|uniref:hypothetical protein n=1 Tax=Candidatus Hadarchaeum sp. TaxID=2883567 RepID=UPI0031823CA1
MIAENTAARDAVLASIKRYLSHGREGIHVSSLIYPLKHYYRAKYPDIAVSDRLVGFFVAGKGHHAIIQMLASQPQYREVTIEWMGIRGTVDIFDDRVIEIKTTRLTKLLTPERVAAEHAEWITQLSYYMAMSNCLRGQLWLFYLGVREKDQPRTSPAFQIFDVFPGDVEAIRAEMLGRKQLLERALANNNPSILPPCPPWMCRDCEFNHLCGHSKKEEAVVIEALD